MKYEYSATLVKVVDGDTFDFLVDLGLYTFKKIRVRLHGCNTPELRGAEKEEGKASKQYVIELFKNSKKQFKVTTHKDKKGKYGRWLADVWLTSDLGKTESLAVILCREGYGKPC